MSPAVVYAEYRFVFDATAWCVTVTPAGEITVMRRRNNLHSAHDPGAWEVVAWDDPAYMAALTHLWPGAMDVVATIARRAGVKGGDPR